jgi:hypothetical protein
MNIEIAPRNKWLTDTKFDEARMYCLFLEIDGKQGWRLPTDEEADMLVNIVDPDNDFEHPTVPPELKEFNEYWFDDDWGFWTQGDIDGYYSDLSNELVLIPVRDL